MTNIIEIEDLAAQLDIGRRLLGIDLGSKTIGLATSDVGNSIATPLTTLKRKKFGENVVELADIIAEYSVYAIIIGLPKNMDNSEGPRCQATRAFVRNMANAPALANVKVCFWDERGSTLAVTNTLIEADVSRAKRKQVVDKLAASFILQGAVDRIYDVRVKLGKIIEDDYDY
ncbi:MAG: Holliday junction resolvase RuvX [Rhizobiales bacterium]|nr:Holliday junction resolvase RuvX [Hyphomicrobiales bacterium]NRB14867.1 Holliday junction resolvase RuvX [Hyphomicrobiales bacterium]